MKIAPDSSVWMIATLDKFPPLNAAPKVYRSIDEGINWNSSAITPALSSVGWDISPVDKNIAYIALDTTGLFRTVDGGQSWSKVDSFPSRRAYLVHFFNQNDGWVVGGDSLNSYYPLTFSVTSDGGNNWTKFGGTNWVQPTGTSLPAYDSTEFFSVNFTTSYYDYSDETIIMATFQGNYWKSTDKGYNWTRHSSPMATSGIAPTEIAMKDEHTFLIGGNVDSSTNMITNAFNFTTTDGGNTWIQGNPSVTPAQFHYLPNSDSVFIVVGHRPFSGIGGRGTEISYDYGKTWQIIDNRCLIIADFLDEKIGYGACYHNSSSSTANGQLYKWNSTISIDDLIKPEHVRLMPNPVSTDLTLEIDHEFRNNDLAIEIVALNGQILSTHYSGYSDKVKISVSDLPNGFYFLRITGGQESVTKKFVKE